MKERAIRTQSRSKSSEGAVALVTGAGNPDGIGFAAARALCDAGARVALAATGQRIHERAEQLGARGFVADLTDWDAAGRLVSEVEERLGPVEVLVNNAGWAQSGVAVTDAPFVALDAAGWERTIDLNLHVTFRMCRLVAPGMAERGCGRIINVSSVTGPFVSQPGLAAYAAAKAGVAGLTRALALELGPHGVTVNSVAPGWIDTGGMSPSDRAAAEHTPLRRPGAPAEAAAAIAFLASPGASYVTGQVIVVDGGNLLQESKGA